MQALEVSDYGGPEVLSVTDRSPPEPGAGEVTIDVEAAGLNFADVEKRRGDYPETPPPPFIPGMEAAGRVTATGPGVDCEVGQSVMCVGREAFAERMTANVEQVFTVPSTLDPTEAAAVPVQWLTAHNCLFEWGELTADETVLILAAAGGVGVAAVQLADELGATVVGTASKDSKLEFASEYGLDHGINYEDNDLANDIETVTNSEGPDIVLDGVGGRAFSACIETIADGGRVVTYGMASGRPGTVATPRLFFQNQSVIGYHLEHALNHRPGDVIHAADSLYDLFDSGTVEPHVDTTYNLPEAPAAYRHLEARETRGKVVIVP